MEKAVRFALTNIKPTDPIIVGMYPRFTDRVKENAELVRRVLRPEERVAGNTDGGLSC